MSNRFPKNRSAVLGRGDFRTRDFVNGHPCIFVPEAILLDTRFSMKMRLLAAWAWGQSINWVFRVEDIRTRLAMTRAEWRTLSVEMKSAGFMQQSKEPDPQGGVLPVHTLLFNFTIFETNQSYPQGSHSREGSKTTPRASGQARPLPEGLKTASPRGVENDQLNRGPNQLGNKQPPPARFADADGGGGGDVSRKEEVDQGGKARQIARALGLKLGLKGDAIDRFCHAAAAATVEQLNLVEPIVRGTRKVGTLEGFCVHLAQKASAGILQPPSTTEAEAGAPALELEYLEQLHNCVISGPSGPIAKVQGRMTRCCQTDLIFPPAITLELIRKVKSGQLDARAPT